MPHGEYSPNTAQEKKKKIIQPIYSSETHTHIYFKKHIKLPPSTCEEL